MEFLDISSDFSWLKTTARLADHRFAALGEETEDEAPVKHGLQNTWCHRLFASVSRPRCLWVHQRPGSQKALRLDVRAL